MSRPATFTQPRPQPVRSKSGPAPAPTGAPKRAPVPLPRSTSGPSAVNYWSFIMIFLVIYFVTILGSERSEVRLYVFRACPTSRALFSLSRSPRKGWDK